MIASRTPNLFHRYQETTDVETTCRKPFQLSMSITQAPQGTWMTDKRLWISQTENPITCYVLDPFTSKTAHVTHEEAWRTVQPSLLKLTLKLTLTFHHLFLSSLLLFFLTSSVNTHSKASQGDESKIVLFIWFPPFSKTFSLCKDHCLGLSIARATNPLAQLQFQHTTVTLSES